MSLVYLLLQNKWIIRYLPLDMLLWKESLNNDGQQFHQYPQNIHPPLTSTHWTLTSHLKSLNTHLSPQIIEHPPLTSNHWTPTSHLKSLNTNSHLKSLNTHLSPQIIEHKLSPQIIEHKIYCTFLFMLNIYDRPLSVEFGVTYYFNSIWNICIFTLYGKNSNGSYMNRQKLTLSNQK
jgi:hypothetical protein